MNSGVKWLLACLALALGEGAGACLVRGADAWPFFAVLATLVALLGYGFRIPSSKYLALAALGVALFLGASVESEHALRETPWMRYARRHERAETSRFEPIRRSLAKRIGIGLDHNPRVRALNRAILLGGRENLDRKAREVFVAAGAIHVFAISGMHVMMVAGVIDFLLALFLVPLRWRGLCVLPFLWGYVAIIGFPPSAIRAATMASFYFLAPLFYRKSDAVMAWAWTFLIVHIASPRMIANVGCQLSFAVTLALIAAGRMARNEKSGWLKTLLFALAAWVASAPICAYAFGRVTLGGILANVLLAVVAGYSVVAGVVGVVASFVSETLAAHINNFAALVTGGMATIAEAVARLPGASFEVGRISAIECAEWYALVALSLYLYHSVRRRRDLI